MLVAYDDDYMLIITNEASNKSECNNCFIKFSTSVIVAEYCCNIFKQNFSFAAKTFENLWYLIWHPISL